MLKKIKALIPRPIKILIEEIILLPRIINARQRVLPNFIIVGAQKSGTTSLYDYIVQHPDVLKAYTKEIHFFDLHFFSRSINWYKAHFPKVNQIDNQITGEASPFYMVNPHCAERIHQAIPNCKIIFVLRDPVDRAISHYYHELEKTKAETLSIQDGFNDEENRINGEYTKMLSDKKYHSKAYRNFSYTQRGHYLPQLKRYFEVFKKENILVVQSEEMFDNPAKVLKEVYSFLGVESSYLPNDLKPKNIRDYSGKIDESLIEELKSKFKEKNIQLENFLNRKFNWK